MAKNGNFRLLLLLVTQADHLADLPPPQVQASSELIMAISDCYSYRSYRQINWQIYTHPKQRHPMAKNVNCRLLLLQVMQADKLTDPSLVVESSGQEWQFQIAILTGHIGRLTDRSPLSSRGIQWPIMAISDCYCYRSYRHINRQMYPPVEASSGQE